MNTQSIPQYSDKMLNTLKQKLSSHSRDMQDINTLLHQPVCWSREHALKMNLFTINNEVKPFTIEPETHVSALWLVMLETEPELLRQCFPFLKIQESDLQEFSSTRQVIALSNPQLVSTPLLGLIKPETIGINLYFTHKEVLEHLLDNGFRIEPYYITYFCNTISDHIENASKEEINNMLAVLNMVYSKTDDTGQIMLKRQARHMDPLDFINGPLDDELKVILLDSIVHPVAAMKSSHVKRNTEKIKHVIAHIIINSLLQSQKDYMYGLVAHSEDLLLLGVVSGYFDKDFLLAQIKDSEIKTSYHYHQLNNTLPTPDNVKKKAKL